MSLISSALCSVQPPEKCLSSFVIVIFGLVLGVCIAVPVLYALPVSTAGLEAARSLGIISKTILEDYPDDMEAVYYAVGMAITVAVAIVVWIAWALVAGCEKPVSEVDEENSMQSVRSTHWARCVFAYAVFPLILTAITFRWEFLLLNRGSWGFFGEEGYQLGWINALLHGRTLYRDVYCFNGPLMIYPAVWFLRLFGVSVVSMRAYVYLLSIGGIVAVYFCLLRTVQHRSAAYLAGLAMTVIFMPHWQQIGLVITRFFLGLIPVFLFSSYLRYRCVRTLYATGAVLGVCVFFSPEMGLASVLAVCLMALESKCQLKVTWRQVLPLWGKVAVAGLIFALVVCVPIAVKGAFPQFVNILYSYPRYTMMGFAALPIPNLPNTISEFFVRNATAWDVYKASVAYMLPLTYAAFAVVMIIRWLRRGFNWRDSLLAGITVYGTIILRSAIARSDPGHFYLQALLPLCVLGSESLLSSAWQAFHKHQRPLAAGLLTVAVLLLLSMPAQALVNRRASVFAFKKTFSYRIDTLRGKPSFMEQAARDGYGPVDLPRTGRAWFSPYSGKEIREVVSFIEQKVPRDEEIFVYPNSSMFYFLCDRPNATRFAMTFYAVTKSDRREMLSDLERKPPRYIILHSATWGVDGISDSLRVPQIARFVHENYKVVKDISPHTAILEKKQAALQ